MNRLALIGDVHAEDTRLECALAHVVGLGVDGILATGDIVDGPGDLDRAVALLRAHGVCCVRGNHERWFLEGAMRSLPMAHVLDTTTAATAQWLRALPATARVETNAGALLLCHGVDDDDMQRLLEHDSGYALECNDALQRLLASRRYRFMVGGHTHQRMVRRFSPDLWVLNPGTLTGERAGFSVVDFSRAAVDHFELDAGSVRLSHRVSLRATEEL